MARKPTPAVFWSWATLVDRGWTNDLYARFLRGPDRTPRGKGQLWGERGTWGFLKSRVLAAEATDAFKAAVREARREQRRRKRSVEALMTKADDYEYVAILRHMPENPSVRMTELLGKDGWRRTARHPWTDNRSRHVYLIRDAKRMTALLLSEFHEQIVEHATVTERKVAVLRMKQLG